MSIGISKLAVAAGGALALTLLVTGIPASEARTTVSCLRMKVEATGATTMWNEKDAAKRYAVEAWQKSARTDPGPAYAFWGNARYKSLKMNIVSKSTISYTAKATPCKKDE